tara:strand:+ start:118 stop:318 length:201 start_codon:yes stop_codon:yes gene_type:complete
MNNKKLNRGTTDDWESLLVIIQSDEILKERIINRLRALKRISENRKAQKDISEKQMREFRLEKKRK